MIRISNFLVKVDYKHIYHERSSKADALANAGANVEEGHWKIQEFSLEELKLMRLFKFSRILVGGVSHETQWVYLVTFFYGK